MITAWFHCGLKKLEVVPKEGIDPQKALGHITAIMRSFEPEHGHKEAGCAYLCSLWFEEADWEANPHRTS